ncbi:flagellar basal body rod protein FlgB [Aquisalimonas asiatica]|uniref:Flagellar basal body rod protein FlgB n=1 Tax=Aquisalimonas asiatica TaxID=406100 RepID=A0A1H8UJE2_9GAMM|nr:flagellar basal body rod protein FlgB [Aquisalimonas asiatica]SEP03350.1 flagellar basal-body rod protein FlgB [Aquisalimonas asiatica]
MAISFDNAVGPHAAALKLRGERHQLLSENIANADTPNYKARDMDFRTALQQAENGQANSGGVMQTTHAQHIPSPNGDGTSADALYRVPNSPSLDGNTVESQVEQAQFAENTVKYRASLDFLGGRISNLVGAIRGE